MRLTTRGKVTAVLAIGIVLIGVPLLAGVVYLRNIGVIGSSDPGKKVSVEIPERGRCRRGRRHPRKRGIIDSGFGFRVALYLGGGSDEIQAGSYEIATGLTPRDALAALQKGPIVEFVTVTYPEGSWLVDLAEITGQETHIDAEAFLEVARSGKIRSKYMPEDVDSLEGLLFASTYQVVKEDTAATLVRRLVDEFDKQMGQLDLGRLDRLGITPYEAVIVASMVEGEARVPEEQGKIARVIYNRIEAGDRLGIDATVLYALGEHKQTLTSSDLAIDSPYNTRLHTGLPPTPIRAPGVGALEAAVDPPQGDWYYFVVSDCEGHHAFSETNAEFLQDKARYQELTC